MKREAIRQDNMQFRIDAASGSLRICRPLAHRTQSYGVRPIEGSTSNLREGDCAVMHEQPHVRFVRWFDEIGMDDLNLVGGKNASLGELAEVLHDRIKVPEAFAITVEALRGKLPSCHRNW